MFQTDQTKQASLFAFSHRDLVSEESDAWLYIDLFDALDLSDFDSDYEYQGQAAKEPRLMLRTLFYGLTHGVVSGRKLSEVCRNDNRFIVLSGNLRPDRRTFDRFIRRHGERFSGLFVQVVRLAQEMGLVSLGRVAIDGSKVKAAADRDMVYAKMGRAMAHIEENLKLLREDLARANAEEATELEATLQKEIRDQEVRRTRIAQAKAAIDADFSRRRKQRDARVKEKARRALVDPEALPLSNRRGGFMHGYNVQAAVDEKAQIVVAQGVHDNATDFEALAPLVDQVQENCGKHGESYVADNGYQSLENVKKVKEVGSKAVICRKPSKAKKGRDEEIHEQVFRGSHDREYFCKDGRKLFLASRDTKGGWLNFKMPKGFCHACPHQETCHLFGKKYPQVYDDPNRAMYTEYLSFSRTDEWKDTYKRRKAIVEAVFGNIKGNKGLRIFVRGKQAVSAWWSMATTAHNIEKIIGRIAQSTHGHFSILVESILSLRQRVTMMIHISYGR